MSAIAKGIRAGHEAGKRLHARAYDSPSGLWFMTAIEVLAAAADTLGGRLDGCALYIGDQRVASTDGERVKVWHALVYNGHCHEIPEGCDDAVTTPRRYRDPVRRVVEAIQIRQAARAKSLPVPAGDPGRDTEEVCCAV